MIIPILTVWQHKRNANRLNRLYRCEHAILNRN